MDAVPDEAWCWSGWLRICRNAMLKDQSLVSVARSAFW